MSGLIPKYVDQVNTILRWWENPCDAPWTLYLETAKEPAGNLVLSLLSFGMDDVVRGAFKPKGIRSYRHLRTGRKSGLRGVGIPELGEEIGKRWPGASELRERHVSQGVKNLWMVDGVIQRGLWYWMVADVTLAFFSEWLSAIQESEVCRIQRVGAAAFEDENTFIALIGWTAFGGVKPLYQHGSVSVTGSPALWVGGFLWTSGACSTTFAVERVHTGPTPPTNTFEIRLLYEGQIAHQEQGHTDPNDPNKQSLVISPRRFRGGGRVTVEVRIIPSGAAVLSILGVGVQTIGDL